LPNGENLPPKRMLIMLCQKVGAKKENKSIMGGEGICGMS
jgi:hypothetical protein